MALTPLMSRARTSTPSSLPYPNHQPHRANVPSVLHGNDTQVILFVHPNQERLRLVVVDPTSLRVGDVLFIPQPCPRREWSTDIGPESTGIGRLQEPIALLEEEVVLDELILRVLRHSLKNALHGKQPRNTTSTLRG